MNIEKLAGYIEVQDSIVTLSLPGRPVLVFSAQLPARRYIGENGYTEKGWLWCAFQEAFQEAGIVFKDPRLLFEAIWNVLEGAQEFLFNPKLCCRLLATGTRHLPETFFIILAMLQCFNQRFLSRSLPVFLVGTR